MGGDDIANMLAYSNDIDKYTNQLSLVFNMDQKKAWIQLDNLFDIFAMNGMKFIVVFTRLAKWFQRKLSL